MQSAINALEAYRKLMEEFGRKTGQLCSIMEFMCLTLCMFVPQKALCTIDRHFAGRKPYLWQAERHPLQVEHNPQIQSHPVPLRNCARYGAQDHLQQPRMGQ